MLSLIMKLIAVPLLVGLADAMLTDVLFPSITSIVLTGLAIAVISIMIDAILLRRGTLWLTTVVDWAAAAAILYLSQSIWIGALVSSVGALLAGGLIAIFEYAAHRYALVRQSATYRY